MGRQNKRGQGAEQLSLPLLPHVTDEDRRAPEESSSRTASVTTSINNSKVVEDIKNVEARSSGAGTPECSDAGWQDLPENSESTQSTDQDVAAPQNPQVNEFTRLTNKARSDCRSYVSDMGRYPLQYCQDVIAQDPQLEVESRRLIAAAMDLIGSARQMLERSGTEIR